MYFVRLPGGGFLSVGIFGGIHLSPAETYG